MASILPIACAPPSAVAYTGGRQPVEVLGYDSIDRKVFYVVRDESEVGYAPAIYYVIFSGTGRPRVVRVPGPEYEGDEGGDAVEAKIGRLRRRVIPLVPAKELTPHFEVDAKRLADVTLDEAGQERVKHFRLHAVATLAGFRGEMTRESVCNVDVRNIAAFRVVVENALIAVVAYSGGQPEYCDEVETCIPLTSWSAGDSVKVSH